MPGVGIPALLEQLGRGEFERERNDRRDGRDRLPARVVLAQEHRAEKEPDARREPRGLEPPRRRRNSDTECPRPCAPERTSYYVTMTGSRGVGGAACRGGEPAAHADGLQQARLRRCLDHPRLGAARAGHADRFRRRLAEKPAGRAADGGLSL